VDFTSGSRAVVTQRTSLETWDEADHLIAKRLASVGVTWTRKETWWGRRLLFAEEYAADDVSGNPTFLNVPQPTVERVLRDSAHDLAGLVEFRWNSRVLDVVQDDDRVTLLTEEGPLTAPWVIGADGARSTVRTSLGIDLPRRTSRNVFVIADVRDVDGQFPFPDRCRRFQYARPGDRDGHLLAMPQPDGVWRLDWQSPERLDLDAEGESGRLDDRIKRIVGDVRYTVEWLSQYRFENGVARSLRAGRVLLAGDAGHRLSPFGGRGMNSGIADAALAARAVANALRGDLTDLLGYDADRRRAALVHVAATSRALRVMEPRSAIDRATRAAALLSAEWSPRARRHLDTGPYIPDRRIRLATAVPRP
jgi:2-polyprenyl-6-methoxyphenol hydroxylase-like FAD-dependent oxidoreductase